METIDSGIPWSTAAGWQEANASLAHSLARHRRQLAEARRLARTLHDRLISLFPLLDDLCARTCPACTDVCCRRAWVWADFRDLLFFHLAGVSPPEAQLPAGRGEHCRYGTAGGCRLDRLQRPFVCTWYICPAQTRWLERHPARREKLNTTLTAIKKNRRRMEDVFIHGVFR